LITYTPPKVISRAPSVVEPKGKGTVVVQVLVNANGSFKVMRIMRSTNPGDNAAAMDIAKHSKYAPAVRNGKPVAEFFDFAVSFGENVVSGAAGKVDTLLHQSQWAAARAAAQSALAENPNDSLVQAQLGVADAFLHDVPGAVAAFDKAGTVPAQYQNVAMQAYALQAQSLITTDKTAALAMAQKAVSMGGDYDAYYALAEAQNANGDTSGAQASLEKAKTLAANANPPAAVADRVNIDEGLMQLATARGDSTAAAGYAADIKAIDPELSQKIVAYSYDTQGTALQNRRDFAGAVKMYEQAAAADPAWAGPLEYTKAAILLASQAVPNYIGAKAEADKAIAADPNYALAYYVGGVALAKNALVAGNDNQAGDADILLRKAAALAQAQHNDDLARAALSFAQNHAIDANLQQWSTQIVTKPLPGSTFGQAGMSHG
jgi:hypothetical protein